MPIKSVGFYGLFILCQFVSSKFFATCSKGFFLIMMNQHLRHSFE